MQELTDPSVVSPFYESGDYFSLHADYDRDGPYKVRDLLKLLLPYATRKGVQIRSFADVGCGGGSAAVALAQGLRAAGHPVQDARGYEVSPHVTSLRHDGIEFRHEDFSQADTRVDLVTMFDVFEHVPDPVGFLRNVAARCDLMGLHIPLDDSVGNGIFNRFRGLMDDPGHIMYLDTASALTVVAMAGILTLDYRYTIVHRYPTGRGTLGQKFALPIRAALTFVSPWLAAKTVGGVSLMVLAVTPKGLDALNPTST